MDKSKINLERLRAYDAEWEEDKHPRAENGQFTSGAGGRSGGKTESGNEYGYSRSEQHVANKMEEWGNEQGNIAALEAADAFRDAHEDENDMREVLKSVRQHLVENENDIRGYDENPKNFDKVMEQLDDMESMLDDQDDYEFKHGEIKSPLRQAAETIQGGGSEKPQKADEPAFDFSVEKPADMSNGFFYDVYKPEILSERLHESISKQKYDDVNDYVNSLKNKGFNVSEPEEYGNKQYKVKAVYHDDYIDEDVKLITYYRGRSKEAGTPAGGFYR